MSSRLLNWPYSDGAGRAILYVNPLISERAVNRARLAWWGQMRMHSPQSMHRSLAMTALPPWTRMASVGQRLMQLVQPTHLSSFSVTEW